ncbi:transposase InsO family protein [Chryseoglobus frigidaquae]|uniref:Transposase InsO family protein n=1 Tax=Microcella frigidaquae TaxID=424758 RepID=A0A840XNY9_9MICO|nr:transposase InsO family protein [Microcella frigidaquae]
MLIFVQNSRSFTRGCDGAPGDRIGARPVTSFIQFDGLPTTPSDQVLLPPVEPSQFTSWLFGTRMREAGLMGSMGKVASAYDNALMESFWGSMQIELLDRRAWGTRRELATAMFEWIEGFYNRRRRHSALGYLSPDEFETLHKSAVTAA